ncbi:Prenyltransferase and squalene oxidase repeat family protein [Histomonas meleagridis]|uniref:Prenyltransferase and squalene oxidase repeat family protein n=1 Tax=Histomonas meleagridis TaxID=135588 RepID=UPI00355A6806|nr:Prenyltransferase and squalene oxidase repeat family protein [Histomonas meleagridis]KAH0807104.1 Prenyltransferase and squalene oxidase repeat family protein [Histomonas meleagridis]
MEEAKTPYQTFDEKWKTDDEGVETLTTISQKSNESSILSYLEKKRIILKEQHIKYAKKIYSRTEKSSGSSETFSLWKAPYTLFPLRILQYDGEDMPQILSSITNYLRSHIDIDGDFSGMYYDNSHLVTNYGVTMAIALIGTEEAYELVDRQKTYDVLLSLKLPNGSFRTTKGMESDIRSTFTALLIAYSYNILTPELIEGVEEFILSCKNFDGGFSPCPNYESHGGYLHCGVGAMKILGKLDKLNLPAIIRWITDRQVTFSGGFQGRPNKLVDSCYSWWVGTAARIIADHLGIEPFWNESAMTDYVTMSAQSIFGGFLDHRPSTTDPFHTMYGFAGLCVCGLRSIGEGEERVDLPEVDTMLCCPKDLVEKMHKYFYSKPFVPKSNQ